MRDAPTGILLMAYGTPDTPDDVEPYFTHIRGGRTPSPEAVAHLRHRYELIGGRTPLMDVTLEVRTRLEEHLTNAGGDYRVFVGMKHWHPYIGDVMPRLAADGIERVIAIVLAPHYSRLSIGGYRRAVDEALARLDRPVDVTFVESWHLQPEFISLIADRVRAGLASFDGVRPDEVLTVFSAHSLPVRIREWNDPYEAQLLESCVAVASEARLADWRFAWQSAGSTGEPWLCPDIVEYLETLHGEGVRRVLSVPIGFVCDHLEVQYDIDYEARRKADELGMTLRRTPMPNATREFIETLAAVVARAESGARTPTSAGA